jgi:hypothetical protein
LLLFRIIATSERSRADGLRRELMRDVLLILPALACPAGMGLMAWCMARSGRRSSGGRDEELAQLREELDELRRDGAGQH